MRVSIIVPDNLIAVDGDGYTVDCGNLEGIHAIQWYGNSGEIEYVTDWNTRSKPANKIIDDFSPYAVFLDHWNAEKQMTALFREAVAEDNQRFIAEQEAKNAAMMESNDVAGS